MGGIFVRKSLRPRDQVRASDISTPDSAAIADDHLSGKTAAQLLTAGPARASIHPPQVTIHGTTHDDVITGTAGTDYFEDDWGNDVIDGAGGDDIIVDRGGSDILRGGAGNDYIHREFTDLSS